MTDESNADAGASPAQEAKAPTQVVWDDSGLNLSYANVVNVTSSREEVSLLFGINQTWNANEGELKVKLTERVVLSPFAGKRLLVLLAGVIKEYEARYGALDISGGGEAPKA